MICLYPSTLLHTLAPPPQTPPSTPPQSSAWRCCGPWWKGGGTRGQGGARGRGQTTVACVDAAVARRRRSRDRRLGTSCVAACDGMYPARPVGLVIAGGRVGGGLAGGVRGAGVPKKSRATSRAVFFSRPERLPPSPPLRPHLPTTKIAHRTTRGGHLLVLPCVLCKLYKECKASLPAAGRFLFEIVPSLK